MRKGALLLVGVIGAAAAAFIGLGEDDPPPTQPHAEQSPTPPASGAAATPKGQQSPHGQSPQGQRSPHGQSPHGQAANDGPAAGPSIAGEIVESIDVKGYTYLRLKTADGEVWSAVPTAKVAVGDQARINNATEMANFRSDSLNRTFARIYFGTLAKGGEAPPQGPVSGGGVAKGKPAAGTVDVGKVLPATGDDARTVAQIVAQRKELAGKRIRVRGVVVKATQGVMGRNWLHIQDGTGKAASGDHDLVVTTQATASVGQTVMVIGVVRADKDFGAGYRYDVLLEEAEVTVEPKG